MMTNITCQLFVNKIICNGSVFVEEEKKLTYEDEWFWIYLGIYVGLVLLAGTLTHSRIFSMSSFTMYECPVYISILSVLFYTKTCTMYLILITLLINLMCISKFLNLAALYQ